MKIIDSQKTVRFKMLKLAILFASFFTLDGAYTLELSHYTKRFTSDEDSEQQRPPTAQCTKTSEPCRCTEVYPREIVIQCSRANLKEVEEAVESVSLSKMQLLAVDVYGLIVSQARNRLDDDFFLKYAAQPRAMVIQDCKIKKIANSKVEPFLDLAPNAFRSLEDVMVTLKIDCPTSSESLEAVKKLRALNVLQLNQLKMHHLQSLPFDNLIHLDLRRNKIQSMDQATFERCGQLEILNLAFNSLKSFETVNLSPLDNLKELLLSHNGLESIKSTFEGTPMLEHMDMSHNNLKRLPYALFATLSKLKILKLEFNGLTDIEKGNFDGLTNLEILSLHENKLETIRNFSLKSLSSLKSVFLSKTCEQIENQNNAAMVLEDQAFSGLSNLRMLDFDCNKLKNLKSSIFANTPSLKYLILANVKIQESSMLSNESFENLGALTHIYFAGFDLNLLQDESIFRPLTSLQELNLVSYTPSLLQCQNPVPLWFENFIKNDNNFTVTLPNCLPARFQKLGR